MTIEETLLSLKNDNNADFQAKLTPSLPREYFLGIKVPVLRKIEQEFRGSEEASCFLSSLPHRYYDENLLHSVFISQMTSSDIVFCAVQAFLPYIDNWAVCDTLRPVAFKKNKNGLMEKIKEWSSSSETYICRFGIGMLMAYYLDSDFLPEYLALPAGIHSNDYYINMMIAWYYATALAKQWNHTLPYLENAKLDIWVHNKTIQKACESYRITDNQKVYLKTLKRQKGE